MDFYVDLLLSNGGSMIMFAKSNSSQQVTDASKSYGGFHLGSIGGPAELFWLPRTPRGSSASTSLNWVWNRSGRSRQQKSLRSVDRRLFLWADTQAKCLEALNLVYTKV